MNGNNAEGGEKGGGGGWRSSRDDQSRQEVSHGTWWGWHAYTPHQVTSVTGACLGWGCSDMTVWLFFAARWPWEEPRTEPQSLQSSCRQALSCKELNLLCKGQLDPRLDFYPLLLYNVPTLQHLLGKFLGFYQVLWGFFKSEIRSGKVPMVPRFWSPISWTFPVHTLLPIIPESPSNFFPVLENQL